MKVVVYPADSHGCGHHRIIWPAMELQRAGHDVRVVLPKDRTFRLHMRGDQVHDIELGAEADVVVFQRVTHTHLAQAIPLLRTKGVAVVVDVDDDLTAIHPGNAAFEYLHPRNLGKRRDDGQIHLHSWRTLQQACRDASWVTVTTPALADRYAPHGRVSVLPNYLAEHYYQYPGPGEQTMRGFGANLVGWPASLHNHPNDPDAVGNAVARLVDDGARFRVYGTSAGARHAFGLQSDPESVVPIEILDWAAALDELTVGICPLADTVFNGAKSFLKPLELAARGVPWVGSPRTEYRRLHALGCGHLAEKPKEWYGITRKLLRDPVFWSESADAGQDVAKTLRLRDHAWRWMDAWDAASRVGQLPAAG